MFEKNDFVGDTVVRLSAIVMDLLGKNPTTKFEDLMMGEKRKFNVCLNAYIQSLPEDWETKIIQDFNNACNDGVFNEKFDATSFRPARIDTDIQHLPKEEVVLGE
jgi:hypothetical protein